MPKRPQFTPAPDGGKYRVDIPATLSPDGKRRKRFFDSESEAEKFAKTLRTSYHTGLRGTTISPILAKEAAEAEELLEPFGLSVLEAARMVAAQFAAKEGSKETFESAFLAFTERQEEFWRPRYRDDMHKIPRWVGKKLMEMPVGAITDEIIKEALRAHGAKSETTIKARFTRVKSVISGRGSKPKASGIVILSHRQCGQMLRACTRPEEKHAVALLLFAGIRPSAQDGEISRLEWVSFGSEEIYISAEVSKTRTDRHIPLTPRLLRLTHDRPEDGSVLPPRWKLAYQRIRRAAGLHKEQDVMRHTFASHFLAVFGEDATKSAMGHTPDSATLFRHYRRAVTRKQGLAFFGIKTGLQVIGEAANRAA